MVYTYFLEELLLRFIYVLLGFILSFTVCFFFSSDLVCLIIEKYLLGFNLQYTNLLEVVFCELKLAFSISIVVAVALLVLNIVLFSISGLFLYQFSKYLKEVLVGINVFVIGYLSMGIYFIKFYIYYLYYIFCLENKVLKVIFEPKVVELINFFISLVLFNLCLFIFFIILIFYLNKELFVRYRIRVYSIFILFILLVLPPDIVLHLGVVSFFILICEFFILLKTINFFYQVVLWDRAAVAH